MQYDIYMFILTGLVVRCSSASGTLQIQIDDLTINQCWHTYLKKEKRISARLKAHLDISPPTKRWRM